MCPLFNFTCLRGVLLYLSFLVFFVVCIVRRVRYELRSRADNYWSDLMRTLGAYTEWRKERVFPSWLVHSGTKRFIDINCRSYPKLQRKKKKMDVDWCFPGAGFKSYCTSC